MLDIVRLIRYNNFRLKESAALKNNSLAAHLAGIVPVQGVKIQVALQANIADKG